MLNRITHARSRRGVGLAACRAVALACALACALAACGAAATPSASSAGTPTLSPATATPCATVPAGSGLVPVQLVPGESTVSYTAHERLFGQPSPFADVVGTTKSVEGEFLVRPNPAPVITALRVVVDLRTLKTDDSNRDVDIRDNYLHFDTYPYAIFTAAGARVVAGAYTPGQAVTFTLAGTLRMRDTTHAETFTVRAALNGDTLTGLAAGVIHISDFGWADPTLAGSFSVADALPVRIDFTAVRASCTTLA